MKSFFAAFSDSAKEFKNLKSLILASLLIALHVVLACFVSIMITDSLRISVSFIASVITGALFGPVMGFVCGILSDLVQFFIKPSGTYFIGWTLNAGLSGLIYGMFFYKKFPKMVEKIVDDTMEIRHEMFERVLYISSLVIPLFIGGLWVFAPLLSKNSETAKKGIELIEGGGTMGVIAGIIIILAAISFVMSVFKQRAIPMTVSILCGFAVLLAAYTDKKTITMEWGFYGIMIMILLYIFVQIIGMVSKHAIDVTYMIRCVIAMLFVAIVVNSIIGTYWLSFMYGKGFNFYFVSRLIKNLIQLPINAILTYYILGFIKGLRKQL